MSLAGRNIVVLDLETLHTATECRVCGNERESHFDPETRSPACHADHQGETYTPFGWETLADLGLAIGGLWEYQQRHLRWFDAPTLEATLRTLVQRQPLLVSFNGLQFDFPLLTGLIQERADHLRLMGTLLHPPDEAYAAKADDLSALADAFTSLTLQSYDLLAEVWQDDPASRAWHGVNSLSALSQANGLRAKSFPADMAPRLWAQEYIADVLNYCARDIENTCRLFEMACRGEPLQRIGADPVLLRRPVLPPKTSHPEETS